MIGKTFRFGFANVATLAVVLLLTVGVVAAVVVVSRGTGFVNFASQEKSFKWIGTIGKTPCTNTTPDLCYKLYENNLEGTPHYITSTNQDLESFVAKNVLVRGQEQKVNKITYIVATKISETELSNLSEQVKPIEANLGLKIVPVLGLEMGKVDLNLTWTDKVKANNPQEVEQIKEYSFAVYKNSVKPANLVGVRVVDTTLSDAPRSITGVMVGNGDYLVQMRVYYQRPGGKVYKIKSQAVGFSYFQDKFDKTAINSFWQVDNAPSQYDYVGILPGPLSSNFLSARIKAGQKTYDAAGVIAKISGIGNPFSAQVDITDADFQNKSLGKVEFTNKNNSNPKTNELLVYKKVDDIVLKGCVTNKCSAESTIANFPVTLAMQYDGKEIKQFLNGAIINDREVENLPTAKIALQVSSGSPYFPSVSALFDNFRLVWVK